jgi:hypothetical protein
MNGEKSCAFSVLSGTRALGLVTPVPPNNVRVRSNTVDYPAVHSAFSF